MNKVVFGVDVKFSKTKAGWNKSTPVYPRWSEITKSQKIKEDQTTIMRTGEEFGVMCLDLDTKKPSHPDAKFIMEEFYQLAPTVVQETQNGFHFFYKWDKRLAKSSSKVTKAKDSKLDIKSNMGLVNIKAPVPYYTWWSNTNEIQGITNKMWEILRNKLTNRYLGIPLSKQDEIQKLDKLIQKFEEDPTNKTEKNIQSQQRKIENYDRTNNFNDSDVQRAKDYPIRQLLDEPTATVVTCISPDHEDKTPSMQITGNFAFCHGCNFHADSLTVYQILHDCTFGEAITALTKG